MPKWLLVVGLLLVSPGAGRAQTQPPIFQQQQVQQLQQQEQQLRLQQNEQQQQLLQQQTIVPPLGPRVGVPVNDAELRALEVQLDAEQLELTRQQSQLLQPTPPGVPGQMATPQDRMRGLQENQRLQFQLQQQQLQMQQQQQQQQLLQQHLMDQQQRLNQLQQPTPGAVH
jgi:hypothetical protein